MDEPLLDKLRILIDKENGFGMSIYVIADYCLCDHSYIRRLCKRQIPLAPKTRQLIYDGLTALMKDINERVGKDLTID